jgi:hypothetical protein
VQPSARISFGISRRISQASVAAISGGPESDPGSLPGLADPAVLRHRHRVIAERPCMAGMTRRTSDGRTASSCSYFCQALRRAAGAELR